MIHLRAENWSSLGDDTFWCWAEREWPGAAPAGAHPVGPGDHVLHYGLLGAPKADADRSVALLWEQHPEMQREVAGLCGRTWDAEIGRLHAAAVACPRRTVASAVMADDYRDFGPIDVLPIGVDTDLWRPAEGAERAELRERHAIPKGVRLGFWGGHDHPMKGWDLFQRYAGQHPEVWWVVAFKRPRDKRSHMLMGLTVAGVSQDRLSELMRMCDFALLTSRLRPYAMLEWEAMASNLPVVNVGHPRREFEPGPDPRFDVFQRGWDRPTVMRTWLEYLGAR